MIRPLALAAALAAAPGLAQSPLPDEVADPEARERFRLCRAAVFVHLDRPEGGRLPHAVAEAMLEQFNLIMFETIRGAPGGDVEEASRALRFTENFFLSFSRALVEHGGRLAEREAREAALVDCQPFLWDVLKQRIDAMMRDRDAAPGG